ncbi:F0F1 ATP synthase subunit delta [Pseudofrancisella aestuarii]|uniref:ATP synthase subunit delta n=1 Tax=Pseudofrancisella aestuarii TaxID=2670347 RepID=A0ABV9TEC3_9GAMM|nr:F0F1 ATP synthase subunit delta [Pseudofrancisella aestuarii]
MTNLNIIAKPYARAAYEYAKENGVVDQWLEALSVFKALVTDKNVLSLISSPIYSQTQIVSAIVDQLTGKVDQKILNFLMLIAEKNKLLIIPQVKNLFEEFKDLASGNKKAVVILAYETDKALLKELKDKLAKRFNCTIDMDVKIDSRILGGAVVRVGDAVIDNSVSGRLEKMKNILLS